MTDTFSNDGMTTTSQTTGGLRGRAAQKLQGARGSATGAISSNPLAVLAGGLAVGVVAGALLPRSERERAALDPIGRRLSEGAAAALTAAKDTGKERLNTSILSRDIAQESAKKIFQSAMTAAKGSDTGGQTQAANTPQAPTIA
jgi:hypothetical protein